MGNELVGLVVGLGHLSLLSPVMGLLGGVAKVPQHGSWLQFLTIEAEGVTGLLVGRIALLGCDGALAHLCGSSLDEFHTTILDLGSVLLHQLA